MSLPTHFLKRAFGRAKASLPLAVITRGYSRGESPPPPKTSGRPKSPWYQSFTVYFIAIAVITLNVFWTSHVPLKALHLHVMHRDWKTWTLHEHGRTPTCHVDEQCGKGWCDAETFSCICMFGYSGKTCNSPLSNQLLHANDGRTHSFWTDDYQIQWGTASGACMTPGCVAFVSLTEPFPDGVDYAVILSATTEDFFQMKGDGSEAVGRKDMVVVERLKSGESFAVQHPGSAPGDMYRFNWIALGRRVLDAEAYFPTQTFFYDDIQFAFGSVLAAPGDASALNVDFRYPFATDASYELFLQPVSRGPALPMFRDIFVSKWSPSHATISASGASGKSSKLFSFYWFAVGAFHSPYAVSGDPQSIASGYAVGPAFMRLPYDVIRGTLSRPFRQGAEVVPKQKTLITYDIEDDSLHLFRPMFPSPVRSRTLELVSTEGIPMLERSAAAFVQLSHLPDLWTSMMEPCRAHHYRRPATTTACITPYVRSPALDALNYPRLSRCPSIPRSDTLSGRKVGIVTYAFSDYILYFNEFVEQWSSFFLADSGVDLHFFVVSRDLSSLKAVIKSEWKSNVHLLYSGKATMSTMSGSKVTLLRIAKGEVMNMDFVYYVDVDTAILETVGTEVLDYTVAVVDTEFYGEARSGIAFDSDPELASYIGLSEGRHYYSPKFFGGTLSGFLTTVDSLVDVYRADAKGRTDPPAAEVSSFAGYVNRVFATSPPTLSLDPTYMYVSPILDERFVRRPAFVIDGQLRAFCPKIVSLDQVTLQRQRSSMIDSLEKKAGDGPIRSRSTVKKQAEVPAAPKSAIDRPPSPTRVDGGNDRPVVISHKVTTSSDDSTSSSGSFGLSAAAKDRSNVPPLPAVRTPAPSPSSSASKTATRTDTPSPSPTQPVKIQARAEKREDDWSAASEEEQATSGSGSSDVSRSKKRNADRTVERKRALEHQKPKKVVTIKADHSQHVANAENAGKLTGDSEVENVRNDHRVKGADEFDPIHDDSDSDSSEDEHDHPHVGSDEAAAHVPFNLARLSDSGGTADKLETKDSDKKGMLGQEGHATPVGRVKDNRHPPEGRQRRSEIADNDHHERKKRRRRSEVEWSADNDDEESDSGSPSSSSSEDDGKNDVSGDDIDREMNKRRTERLRKKRDRGTRQKQNPRGKKKLKLIN